MRPVVIAHGFFSALTTALYASLGLGLVVSSPFVAYELYSFIKPGLYPHELRALKTACALSALLFTLGCAYAYYFVLPTTFLFMVWMAVSAGAQPVFSLESLFSTALAGMVLTGATFTYPLFVYALVRAGVLRAETLRAGWRYVVLVVLVVAAAVTPDPGHHDDAGGAVPTPPPSHRGPPGPR